MFDEFWRVHVDNYYQTEATEHFISLGGGMWGEELSRWENNRVRKRTKQNQTLHDRFTYKTEN